MKINLPNIGRPRGSSYKRLAPGLDLPAWFYGNIKSIDEKLYFVYHPYRVLWDDVMNQYYGSLDDPRNTIHYKYGEENWGWVLTDSVGRPLPDGSWHLWRVQEPFGWTHVVKVDSKDPDYLSLLTERLWLQATLKNKGKTAWRDKQIQDQQDQQEKDFKDREAKFNDIRDENSWLTKKAMENMEYGRINPTRPTKDVIASYQGQGNRSRIVRPITDREGGIVTSGD